MLPLPPSVVILPLSVAPSVNSTLQLTVASQTLQHHWQHITKQYHPELEVHALRDLCSCWTWAATG